jgi:hypothetical protein
MTMAQHDPKARDPIIAAFELTAIALVGFLIAAVGLLALAQAAKLGPAVAFKVSFWLAFLGACLLTIAACHVYSRLSGANRILSVIVPLVVIGVLTLPVFEVHSRFSACNGGQEYPLDRNPCEIEDGIE